MQAANPSEAEAGIDSVFQRIFVRWAANLILKNVFDSIDEKEFGREWDPFWGRMWCKVMVILMDFPQCIVWVDSIDENEEFGRW